VSWANEGWIGGFAGLVFLFSFDCGGGGTKFFLLTEWARCDSRRFFLRVSRKSAVAGFACGFCFRGVAGAARDFFVDGMGEM